MDNITQLSMAIVKASRVKETGEMKLRMVNSDTGEDLFGEKMSVELFEDFIRRSDGNMKVPAPFDEVIDEDGYWEGGAPYLSIAHYKSGAGKNVPGEQESLYLDGDKLKSKDILYDTELGNAVWKSVYNDLYVKEKNFEDPVRLSIGFLDLEHKHTVDGEDEIFTRETLEDKCELCADGTENKTYLKGHLVHKAFTRKPAHPRTNVEIEMKSDDEITTREDDAKSIIGDIELEKKSQVDEVLVVKTEMDLEEFAWSVRSSFYSEFVPDIYVRAVTENSVIVYEEDVLYKVGYTSDDKGFSFDKRSKWEKVEIGYIPVKSEANDEEWRIEFDKESSAEKSVTEEVTMEKPDETKVVVEEKDAIPEVVEEEAPVVEESKSSVDAAADALKAKMAELKDKGIFGAAALVELQPFFNEMGEVVKSEVEPDGVAGDIAGIIKSTMKDEMVGMKQDIVAEVVRELSGYVAQSPVEKASETPVVRSLTKNNIPTLSPEGQVKKTQIQRIAEASVKQ